MDDSIINIRFWYWHLIVGKKTIEWGKNEHFVKNGLKDRKKIEIYKFFKRRNINEGNK